MKHTLIALACFLLIGSAHAQTAADQTQIKQVILNYVEAFYEADTTKAYASVAQDLAKRGYYTNNGQQKEAKMSFEQLVALSKRWKQTKTITADTPKKITVFEVLDKIATAKVEALWGIDYFHLAKVDGKWMIINVLWQDYPVAK